MSSQRSPRLSIRLGLSFLFGLLLVFVTTCSRMPSLQDLADAPPMTTQEVQQVLQNRVLPKIQVEDATVPDAQAMNYAIADIAPPLPSLDRFPLYGAPAPSDPKTAPFVYVEIFSSSEKANAQKEDERWLVNVADAFNQKKIKASNGQEIQISIRNIPSGYGAQLIASKTVQPAGYSPASDLWLALLEHDKIQTQKIADQLVYNQPGFVVQTQFAQTLKPSGILTFSDLLNAILAGKVTLGYTNPYTSSSSLNLLYTLFWQAAGHNVDNKPLTLNELASPEVNSIFKTFQERVSVVTTTTLDLREISVRSPDKLQAFPLEYQSYVGLKQLPDFQNTQFIPFGVKHNSPLVALPWTTALQQEGLQKFADFATKDAAMRQMAQQMGFPKPDQLQVELVPPLPKGEILAASQEYWKQKKDEGKTVYMMLVIDTSGSMNDDGRLDNVKSGLRTATSQINSGNQVGLITFSNRVQSLVPLNTFDKLQHQRLLAAIDNLTADGSTAMYDGIAVALGQLLTAKQKDPNGQFYLLVLSDGETNAGNNFKDLKGILMQSQVRIYPIAYGEVNQQELQAIAALREATVKEGKPETVQQLLQDLFQVNL